MSKGSANELERQASGPLQPGATSGWGVADAAIVGVVGYAALVLFLLLAMFTVYSIPSLHSLLRFYQLDASVCVLVGLVGGILFAGPLVMWFVRRRKFPSLAKSIDWECSNKILTWAFLAGFVSGIAYSLAKSTLAGRGYQAQSVEYIAAFVVLTGLAGPAAEEIYFRGILFAALAPNLETSQAL